MPTPRQELATLILGRSLDDYVRAYRDDRVSWRVIARNLQQDTGGKVDVTDETLRKWYPGW
jgi:hypothetical protein